MTELEELDLRERLKNCDPIHWGKPLPRDGYILERYMVWRLDGNDDPLKSEESFRGFVEEIEKLDLMHSIFGLEKISKICVHPCDLRVGLGAEQIVRRK